MEKIFNAQEMIASSHIAKARDVALNAKPYTDAIFDAVQALVAHTHIDHPIVKKDEDNPRVAVLALTSDRGMAGPYTSSIIRETESLLARLDAAGKQPELYVYGRLWLQTGHFHSCLPSLAGNRRPTFPHLQKHCGLSG